jgi:hypothetical protein
MTHLLIQAGFVILTLACYGVLLVEINKAVKKTSWPDARKRKFSFIFLTSLVVWAVFVSAWSLSGRMGNFGGFPFNVMPIFGIPLITIVAFTFSKSGKEILIHIPIENIIRLQAFRFIVELLLWALYLENAAPVQMTFEGRNLDVLSGISAPVVAFLFAQNKISKTILVIWNIICLLLLVNIVVTAVLSMPTPFRVFMNEPANTIVTEFPVSWLPALLVPLAYGLHFLSLRQLALQKKSS